MTAIADVRAEVADAIRSRVPGLKVWEYAPEGLSAPAALIVADDPYVIPGPNKEQGVAFGESRLHLLVILILAGGTNQTLTGVLDGLILDVSNALRAANYNVTSVGAPFTDKETYGSQMFCAEIPLRIEITN